MRLWLTGAKRLHLRLTRSVSYLNFGSNGSNFNRWPSQFVSVFFRVEYIFLELQSKGIHPPPLTLSPNDLLSLPTTVTALQFRVSNVITNATLSLLPRTLTSLQLDNEEGLDPAALVNLPPNLTKFSIWLPAMHDDDILSIPRSVTSLCLWSSAKFTEEGMAPLLPPTLVQLRVGIISTRVWDAYRKYHTVNGSWSREQAHAHEERRWSDF